MAEAMITLGATLQDELSTTGSTNAYIVADDGQTVAAAVTAAQAWAASLDALSAAQLTELRVIIKAALPGGIKTAPAAGSRIEQSAVVNLKAGMSGHRFGNLIPGLKNSLIVLGKLDITNAAVTTFTDLLKGAVLGGNYATPEGAALGVLVDAVLSFRKHRRQLDRTSFEV